MAFEQMTFDPPDGLANETRYITTPASEDAARAQIQAPLDQLKTYINETFLPALESTKEGSSGTENIGSAAISSVTGTTVRAQIADLKGQIDAVSATGLSSGIVDTQYIADGAVTHAKMADPDHVVGARFTRSSMQLISSTTQTAIIWDTYSYNPDSSQDAMNTTRMVCRCHGIYTIVANAAFVYGIEGDDTRARIRKNGSDLIAYSYEYVEKGLSVQSLCLVVDCVELEEGDYLELIVYHDSSSNKNVCDPVLSMRRNRF